jgi:protein-tyrosine phosphatase
MSNQKPIRVMFVCAGNICRSPMAEAVFRHLVIEAGLAQRFEIASSGTGSWHAGERPHRGTQAILQKHAISVGDKRAQQLTRDHLATYDYVLAADDENMHDIRALRVSSPGEVRRLLEFASNATTQDVPDPYYTGGFDRVYDLVLQGCQGLLAHIREKEKL